MIASLHLKTSDMKKSGPWSLKTEVNKEASLSKKSLICLMNEGALRNLANRLIVTKNHWLDRRGWVGCSAQHLSCYLQGVN